MIIRNADNKLVAVNSEVMDISCKFEYWSTDIRINCFIGTELVHSISTTPHYCQINSEMESEIENEALALCIKWLESTKTAIQSMTFMS